MASFTTNAPAKINLYLEVLGRDGAFHRLETLFQTLAWADGVSVQRQAGSGIALRCSDPGLPTDERNLAWRAAAAYCDRRPGFGAVTVDLDKVLPAAGGLGGGSSDAAATLRALAALDPDPLAPAQLAQLAAELGSDVPFFLIGGCAHATGRGEELTPLPDPATETVTLLLPDFGCPTPAVFAALSDGERGPRASLGPAVWATRLQRDLPGCLHNRLQAPAARVQGALTDLYEGCAATGAPWLLSGSGSTLFLLGDQPALPGTRRVVTRFATRAEALAGS